MFCYTIFDMLNNIDRVLGSLIILLAFEVLMNTNLRNYTLNVQY